MGEVFALRSPSRRQHLGGAMLIRIHDRIKIGRS
jgi:hypothetical protein